MEKFVVIESIIFALFILLLRYFISSRSNIYAFIAVSVITTAMEILNENVFPGQGAFYPASLLYFPSFKFPVAIICMGVIYSFLIYFIAERIVEYFRDIAVKIFIFIVSIIVLNFVSLIVEKAGFESGYWIHQKAQNITGIWYQVYLFYFAILLSGAIFIVRDMVISVRMPQNRHR